MPKSTAYLVSEKSTRIFSEKYVNHHRQSDFKIKHLETMEDAKSIVDYVRNRNLLAGMLKLETQTILIRPNETRFGTTALMFDRLADTDEEIKQLFVSRKSDELYKSLNKWELEEKVT